MGRKRLETSAGASKGDAPARWRSGRRSRSNLGTFPYPGRGQQRVARAIGRSEIELRDALRRTEAARRIENASAERVRVTTEVDHVAAADRGEARSLRFDRQSGGDNAGSDCETKSDQKAGKDSKNEHHHFLTHKKPTERRAGYRSRLSAYLYFGVSFSGHFQSDRLTITAEV